MFLLARVILWLILSLAPGAAVRLRFRAAARQLLGLAEAPGDRQLRLERVRERRPRRHARGVLGRGELAEHGDRVRDVHLEGDVDRVHLAGL